MLCPDGIWMVVAHAHNLRLRGAARVKFVLAGLAQHATPSKRGYATRVAPHIRVHRIGSVHPVPQLSNVVRPIRVREINGSLYILQDSLQLSSISNSCRIPGVITVCLISMPDLSIASWRYPRIVSVAVQFSLYRIFMPRNLCSLPLVTVIFPTGSSNFSITSETTFVSLWEIFKSSTYQANIAW